MSTGALLAAFLVAIAFFVYSWSPSRWLEARARAIFAPGALGDWQQQLVKRQVGDQLTEGLAWPGVRRWISLAEGLSFRKYPHRCVGHPVVVASYSFSFGDE